MWVKTYAEHQLPKLVDELCQSLQFVEQPFCLWLKGTLGAGKTTLVRHILRKLGLADNIPVQSPTFTYINEYDIKGLTYAHIDLYRSESDLALEEGGVLEPEKFHGIFVEWPDRIPDTWGAIKPTATMEIAMDETNTKHRIYKLLRGFGVERHS